MAVLSYHNQDISFRFNRKRVVKQWIQHVVDNMSCSNVPPTIGHITFVFCSDSYLRDVNVQYLKHDYFTDVITFDYSTDSSISGDVLISIDTVKTNSQLYGVNFESELLRVMIHGVFHLLGYNDYTTDEFDLMKELEDRALNIFNTIYDR